MIFRDKKTGDLLNIRRDDYTNDRMYFQEIIRVNGEPGCVSNTKTKNSQFTPRYTCPFHDILLQSQYNNT